MNTPNSTTPALYVVEVPAPFPTTCYHPAHDGEPTRVETATVQAGTYPVTFTLNPLGEPIAVAALDEVVSSRLTLRWGWLPWLTFPRTRQSDETAWHPDEVRDGWPAVPDEDGLPPLAIFRRTA